jgi:hypothetical protein
MRIGVRCAKDVRALCGFVCVLCVVSSVGIGNARAQTNPIVSSSFVAVHPGVAPVVVAPPIGHVDGRNSAGWNTGYSAVTSSYERPRRLGSIYGVGDTVQETVTQVVPNDAWGRPMRGGIGVFGERNSAGWSTGYSAVTSTYERSGSLDNLLTGQGSITETTTRVVPNDFLGKPILGIWP